MMNKHSELAAAFLKGAPFSQTELEGLIKALKAANAFGLARKVLDHAAGRDWSAGARTSDGTEAWAVWLQQQRALCTYKDADSPPLARLREALGILDAIGLFAPDCANPETLGLGGAIYKRLWEQEGGIGSLHAALGLYRKGWAADPARDCGYCGGNAAYMLDQLAHLAERAARGVEGHIGEVERLRAEARQLRQEILAYLEKLDIDIALTHASTAQALSPWALLTRAELHFGLGDYDESARFLAKVRSTPPADWKVDTCVRQLIDIARCQGIRPAPDAPDASKTTAGQAWDALCAVLGDDTEAALGLTRGRVGLALSGGGFRAAFYHLGVLARLAEVDALRHVEVLSTVSGGSIVGALYYQEIKALLENKSDKDVDRDDYLKIVRGIQRCFFAAVKRNLRMRTLASLRANLRMVFSGYTRSQRIGDLYAEIIYGDCALKMSDLLIRPVDHADNAPFKPNEQNWRRHAKVPILLINSTALNSGHNFQFTANWMGEPPGTVGDAVDMNARHRRVYYREAPTKETRAFPLGHAVAASACVPVLFAPLSIKGLYPGREMLLVDGGVHDNQGIGGLLDEHCDFLLCSDASGQMHDLPTPGSSLLGVAYRADEIAQDRVRETQYEDAAARERTGALRGLLFVHLKDGLDPAPIAPIAPGTTCERQSPAPEPNQTPYGIDREIQRLLSEIRTDLDSFTAVEAQTLMLSGYRATAAQLRKQEARHRRKGGTGSWGDFDIDAPEGKWRFLRLAPIAGLPPGSTDLRRLDLARQLEVGKERFFKAFRLIGRLKAVALGIGLLSAGALGMLIYRFRDCTLFELKLGGIGLLLAALAVAAAFPAWRFVFLKTARGSLLTRFALPLVSGIFAKLHLRWIDPCFLKRGRIARLLRLPPD